MERDRERQRRESLQERYREPNRPAASPRHADLATAQQRPTQKRISHEEVEVSPCQLVDNPGAPAQT